MRTKGFTLVEVVVVMGLLGIVTLLSFTVISNTLKSTNFTEDRLSKVLFTQSVQSVMADYQACRNTLNGINAGVLGSDQNISAVRDKTNNIVYSPTGLASSFENLNIQRIRLVNRDINAGDRFGRISLFFHVERTRSGGGPAQFVTDPIDIRVVLDPTGNTITGCATLGTAGGPSQILKFGEAGPTTISGFSETTVMNFSLDRIAAPAEIHLSAHLGGTDIVWATFRLYRETTLIASWTDGTSHSLGAAIRTNYAQYNTSFTSGTQNYRLTVERLSHPSYGTAPMHLGVREVIFKQ
jgi:prepilin-type N-terminal cleavage/methylation domain-containing protein